MPAHLPPRWWTGGVVAGLALLLAACAGFDVRPSLSRSYELVELAPAHLPAEAEVWRSRLQFADVGCDRSRSELSRATDACVSEWRNGVRLLARKPPLEQAAAVNRLVNGLVSQVSDDAWTDRGDHWDTPLHTLRRGGDCEDLALLKRESLQMLGWPEEGLVIVVGESARSRPPGTHVVLLVTLEGGAQLLLDSAEPEIMAPRDNYHFRPAYALTRLHVYKVKPWRRRWWRN